MNKVAHYLQQHLSGEILTSSRVLEYFSTDESILRIVPELVVYPRSEKDIRKTARFTWQLAEKGRVVPITARGMGTDQTGASIGVGIIMAMVAHMNKIIELDPKSGVVTTEAGISLDKLQQVLHTHGRFLPPVSVVNKYATLGGAVANNDSSRASYKYGPMLEYVRSLRVVLANGEVIETGHLSKRELNKKLGLASFEGEIYRALDKLIEDHSEDISKLSEKHLISKAGFNIAAVKQKDGSFDLTPLFLGSQGTLGVISEVTFDTEPYNPNTTFFVAGFADRSSVWKVVSSINDLKEGPSAIDFIDETLLKAVQDINPGILKPLEGGMPAILLFIELDNDSSRSQKKITKKIIKILESADVQIVEPKTEDRDHWERLRDSASVFLTHHQGKKQPVPILDDARIPLPRMPEFLNQLNSMMQNVSISNYAVWGLAGSGLVHVAPLVDIASVGDRQKIFKIMDVFYDYVCSIDGSISGEYAEGRLRGLYNDKQFNADLIDLFQKIKTIFDPTATLNTGVKLNVNSKDVKAMLRDNYVLTHQYAHLPRG